MTKEALNRYKRGNYNDENGGISYSKLFNTAELSDIFLDALITSLVEWGYAKRAEQILEDFKTSFKSLQKQYDKLHKYTQKNPAKAVEKRIEKVDEAAKKTINKAAKGAAVVSGKTATELGVKEINSQIKKSDKKQNFLQCPEI